MNHKLHACILVAGAFMGVVSHTVRTQNTGRRLPAPPSQQIDD